MGWAFGASCPGAHRELELGDEGSASERCSSPELQAGPSGRTANMKFRKFLNSACFEWVGDSDLKHEEA